MSRGIVLWSAGLWIVGIGSAAAAQSGGAAGIEQIPAQATSAERVGVQAVPKSRSSATVQAATADKVPPLVSPEMLAECQKAQAADRAAPADVDCVKALQVKAPKQTPSAEGTLLMMFGQNAAVTTQGSIDSSASVSADRVARQLSSGDFQGTSGSDAAASVARDRPPPQAAPPPR